MKFIKIPLVLTLLATPVFADGVDDPNFYLQSPMHLSRQDPNYWSGFDRNPCSYNLGYHEDRCVNPNSRIIHIPEGSLDDHTPQVQSVPEPGSLLLIGVALTGLAASKKINR